MSRDLKLAKSTMKFENLIGYSLSGVEAEYAKKGCSVRNVTTRMWRAKTMAGDFS